MFLKQNLMIFKEPFIFINKYSSYLLDLVNILGITDEEIFYFLINSNSIEVEHKVEILDDFARIIEQDNDKTKFSFKKTYGITKSIYRCIIPTPGS